MHLHGAVEGDSGARQLDVEPGLVVSRHARENDEQVAARGHREMDARLVLPGGELQNILGLPLQEPQCTLGLHVISTR